MRTQGDSQPTNAISWLSVLIKKHLKHGPGQEALEFNELRDACANEQRFVDLIDKRMIVSETSEASRVVGEGGWFRSESICCDLAKVPTLHGDCS